jgi:dihydropyrimidinase
LGTVIRGGTVVTATDTQRADVLIEGERITMLAESIPSNGHTTIDATGTYVFPGGVDPHTHLDMPFGGTVTADNFETGTRAALLGGTTTIVDFALHTKGDSLHNALKRWHGKADGNACGDYAFHLTIADGRDETMNEIPKIVNEEGVNSFKVFMAYKHVLYVDDETIFKTLQACRDAGGLVQVHAENGDVVHVSSAMAADMISDGRKRGLAIYGETCPQYLVCDTEDYLRPNFEGAKYVLSPPIRDKWNQGVLLRKLKNMELHAFGSDHCSFNLCGQKELGKDDFSKIPNGAPTIEDRLAILYHVGVNGGVISPNQFVALGATNPARFFGLFPRKGTIAVGSDADVVVWDPNAERTISAKTHHMNVDNSVFEGMKVKGRPRFVFSRGSKVAESDTFTGRTGHGKFARADKFYPMQV